jgi:hypothetical protein
MNIYFFGDSHTRIFSDKDSVIYFAEKNLTYKNFCMDAVSLTGINKNNSKLNYFECIKNQFLNININDNVVLKFGQVDMEFVYFYKLCPDLNGFIDELIVNYDNLINKIIDNTKLDKNNIIISLLHLPSYYDDDYMRNHIVSICKGINQIDLCDIDLVQNEIYLKLKDYDILKLTNNNLLFNQKMKEYCIKKKYKFLDTTEYFLDLNTKTLKIEYIGNPDKGIYKNGDHHYCSIYDDKNMIPRLITNKMLNELIKINH